MSKLSPPDLIKYYIEHRESELRGPFSIDTLDLGKEVFKEADEFEPQGITALFASPLEALMERVNNNFNVLIQRADETLRDRKLSEILEATFTKLQAKEITYMRAAKAVGSKAIHPDVPVGGFSNFADHLEHLAKSLLTLMNDTSQMAAFSLSPHAYRTLMLREREVCEKFKINPQRLQLILIDGGSTVEPRTIHRKGEVDPQHQSILLDLKLDEAKTEIRSSQFFLASKSLDFYSASLEKRIREPFKKVDELLQELIELNKNPDPRWGNSFVDNLAELTASVSALRLSMIYFKRSFKYAALLAHRHIPYVRKDDD